MTNPADTATNPDYGRCSVCYRPFQIRPNGTLRHHLNGHSRLSAQWGQACKGAGRAPLTPKES